NPPTRLRGEKGRDDEEGGPDKQHQILPRGDNPAGGRLQTLRHYSFIHPSTARDERSSRACRRMRAPHHIVTNTSEAELAADLEEPPLQHVDRLEPLARGRERERGVLPVDPVAVEHVV